MRIFSIPTNEMVASNVLNRFSELKNKLNIKSFKNSTIPNNYSYAYIWLELGTKIIFKIFNPQIYEINVSVKYNSLLYF